MMTQPQALAEGVRRWGPSAFAYINAQNTPFSRPWYSVGYRDAAGEAVYFNSHESWESALMRALLPTNQG